MAAVISVFVPQFGTLSEFLLTVANSGSRRRLVAGETVRIGWQPEDCRALDA